MDEKAIFMKYFKGSKGNVTVLTNTSNSEIDKLNNVDFEEDLNQFEKPDMYIRLEKHVLLLEHFKVGSSKAINSNRSDTKFKKIAEINRELHKKVVESKDGFVSDSRNLDNKPSVKNYIENLLYQIEKHNKQYKSYIENYIKKFGNNDFEYGVVIENSSALYDIVEIEGKMGYFTPFNIKEFRDYLRSNKNIKHIFYLYFDGLKHNIFYLFNNDKSLDELDSYLTIVTSQDKMLDSNAQVISAMAIIDNE